MGTLWSFDVGDFDPEGQYLAVTILLIVTVGVLPGLSERSPVRSSHARGTHNHPAVTMRYLLCYPKCEGESSSMTAEDAIVSGGYHLTGGYIS
jgi:hypothetical protein